LGDIFGDLLPKKYKKKKVTIKEARKILSSQESEKLIDMDEVIELGIKKAEEDGIIFIDEIDKIAGKIILQVQMYHEKEFKEIFCQLWKVQQ